MEYICVISLGTELTTNPGWKEDFLLLWHTARRGHSFRSTEYLHPKLQSLLARKRNLRILSGRTFERRKSGSVAAMTCDEEVKRRMEDIYGVWTDTFRDFMDTLIMTASKIKS